MNKKKLVRTVAAVLSGMAMGGAGAVDLRPDGVSAQASRGDHDTRMAGAAVVWDWEWALLRRKAAITGQTELFVNHWRADGTAGGRTSYTQVGLLPTLRLNLAQGRSPWFVELGIGVSWMDSRFRTPGRSFSTRFNFYDVLGAGYVFGDHRQHELGLRLLHISNGGIEEPNPGQEFLQLRYLARF
ncbi:acyloxyacyl hydrolase [Ramlibacter sp.]|uniref:acyloxyacyl hydrolase n=1 Tax=Ramlibacter sp. TaxID=1917967 RepID=UPI002FCC566C